VPSGCAEHPAFPVAGRFEHGADEGATFEVVALKPLFEQFEDRKKLFARRGGAPLDLLLEPLPRPQLLATLEERDDQVLLRRKVAIEGHLRHPSPRDDGVDANRANPLPAEELIRGIDQLFADYRRGPSRSHQYLIPI